MKLAKITIGHLIGKKFNYNGYTHIVTLIGEREGASELGIKVTEQNIEWIWLPMENANIKSISPKKFLKYLETVKKITLIPKNNIYIHCSAGIHRTGMITYGVYRLLGYSENESLNILHELRPVTEENVAIKRIKFVERVLDNKNELK